MEEDETWKEDSNSKHITRAAIEGLSSRSNQSPTLKPSENLYNINGLGFLLKRRIGKNPSLKICKGAMTYLKNKKNTNAAHTYFKFVLVWSFSLHLPLGTALNWSITYNSNKRQLVVTGNTKKLSTSVKGCEYFHFAFLTLY